ncbi:disease resistance protein Pik-2-like [Triticum dicoccoides]|uniref:disease resistance protein Pik-2-like n=1 Tax=Triticum dicoccoides TaxID=85692 RepID=UPI0018916705|nr:disease resistance protein Pik-2-like [Triticum dicoccoides]
MADLVVGLAKSVVEGALTKAQVAIEEEAKLRQSAQRNLVFITGEFEMMHSFLKVADEERLENKVVITWVRQIRELAYDVEDCIELVIHLDMKNRWWWRVVPSWCMALPLPLDEAAGEIEQLKARVEDVSTRNTRYSLISDTGSKPVILQQEPMASSAAIVAATTADMLAEARGATKRQQGFSDLTRLISKKKQDHDNGLQVISVWGAAGDHGTTSIIRKTYNHTEICQEFPFRSWVKIMHPFNPHQFMRNMMAQFHATSCMEQRGTIGRDVFEKMEATQQDLLSEFEQLFNEKRYLIVLEGLSHMVDWDAIRAFLPDTMNGSWIIVSTQQSEIATLCIGHSYQVVELRKFSDEHSICALYKASQGDGAKDKNPMGSDGGEDKGKEPMASLEKIIREKKIMSLREEADEWKQKNDALVGREARMTELVKCLAQARVNSLPVMSVWGIAQVGKSALVKNLFYDTVLQLQGGNYEDYYWVDVSHPFNIRDLYLNLLSDFHSEKDPTEECHRLLKKGWCLIVIDDLRSTKDWDMIQAALVSKHLKSVVIVITTDPTIAEYCTNKEELVFNVKALEADAAFDLFKKQVLKKSSTYPLKDQEADVKDLISKCGGLPKVISAIAGLLATKTNRRMEIINSLNQKFMHRLETDLEYDNLQDLFGWMHSYFRTCPDALKPCIFYLSIFPQDQTIRRRRLVRRWIAEGYSRDSDNESAEENGEKHFSKLLELSIIQQISSVDSCAFSVDEVRMVMCQVNGFIREYVVSRRMEENLVFELSGKCALTTQRNGRHLVILEKWKRDEIVFASMDFSRLRSLTVFGVWESFFISESMKMLRVLDLENAEALNDGDLDKIFEWLRRLKFLSLRGHTEINHLPGSLHHLRQLQTLDVRGTSITTLPKKITKLHKLQYIRAGNRTMGIERAVSSSSCSWLPEFCRCHHPTISVEVPTKIGELTALHTLGVVNITASGAKNTVKELKKLTQLRKLGVFGINGKNSSNFFSAIEDHAHLESLSVSLNKDTTRDCCFISKDNNSQRCLDDMISLPCTNLRSLKLYGLEDKLPKWEGEQPVKFGKLTKLELEMASFPEDVIRFVGGLPELCILRVKQHQDRPLNFCVMVNGFEDDSYKKVKILEISCSNSLPVSVTFGSWTMKKLELLKVDCYGGSPPYEFSGLGNLEELKEVVLVNGSSAQALKQELDHQLAEEHPKEKKPVVKLEQPPPSS